MVPDDQFQVTIVPHAPCSVFHRVIPVTLPIKFWSPCRLHPYIQTKTTRWPSDPHRRAVPVPTTPPHTFMPPLEPEIAVMQ